jgi:hypothetical protein
MREWFLNGEYHISRGQLYSSTGLQAAWIWLFYYCRLPQEPLAWYTRGSWYSPLREFEFAGASIGFLHATPDLPYWKGGCTGREREQRNGKLKIIEYDMVSTCKPSQLHARSIRVLCKLIIDAWIVLFYCFIDPKLLLTKEVVLRFLTENSKKNQAAGNKCHI